MLFVKKFYENGYFEYDRHIEYNQYILIIILIQMRNKI